MSRVASLVRSAVVAATVVSMACSADPDNQPQQRGASLEIFSWWTGGGEAAALTALLEQFSVRRPGVAVINSVQPNDDTARARLKERLSRTDPPHTFQALTGRRVTEWLQSTPPSLDPLDEVFSRNDWRAVFLPQMVSLATHSDGHIYCVPINMQRENNLYYDIQTFAELSLEPPRTLADFHRVAARLREVGKVPLALGADKDSAWVVRILFQSVMVAVTGPQYYREFFSGLHSPRDPQFRQALDAFLSVLDETDAAGSEFMDWKLAAQQLANRTAAMLVHGDWVVGELIGLQKVPGQDFGEIPAPGTTGVFVGSSDCFPLPRGLSASRRADAIALLETIGSREGQDAFNPRKGSIPARTDADPNRYDALARQRMRDAATDVFVEGVAALTTESQNASIHNVIARLRRDYFDAKLLGAPDARSASIDGAVESLVQHHRQLAR